MIASLQKDLFLFLVYHKVEQIQRAPPTTSFGDLRTTVILCTHKKPISLFLGNHYHTNKEI